MTTSHLGVEEDLGAQESLVANVNAERRLRDGIEPALLWMVSAEAQILHKLTCLIHFCGSVSYFLNSSFMSLHT